VLTAAHCIDASSGTFTVGGKSYRWSKAVQHSSPSTNDLAVLLLDSAVTSVTPSPLNTAAVSKGQKITLVGFGWTSDAGGNAEGRKYAGTNTISGVSTNELYYRDDSNICNGDSGGPTFLGDNVAGVHSWGEGGGYCTDGMGADARVDYYVKWIKTTAGIGSDNGDVTCVDNASFVDAQGYKCSGWVGYDCTRASEDYGYTAAQEASILANCKKTCNQCSITDQCPNDPNKTQPGQCGCGTPDTDSDNDGTANCKDSCPSDPKKTAPGQCGCGVAEGTCSGTCTDNASFVDAQGYKCSGWVGYDCTRASEDYGYTAAQEAAILANCKKTCNQCSVTDKCPNDPNKTEPGLCGCGVPEGTCSGSSVTCSLNPYSSVSWSTWNQYKANFHTHTTNSDGSDSTSTVVNQYKNAGYAILAITDHNYITSWTAPSGMLRVKGDEYSSSEHVGALFNFSSSSSNLQNGIPHIASQGGMCNIHHPGRDHSSSEWSWFIPWFRDYTCFGLEVFNQGDRYSSDRKLWDNINENFFKSNGRLVWGTSDDDKHDSGDLFGNFQFVLMPALSEANLRTSLKNGAFYFAYEPGRSGSAKVPRISKIVVDNTAKTITITATGANSISWVGPGTSSVSTGSTFNFSKYTKPFVRAVLDGSSGDSYTQPFGFVAK
jgi:hypothetical protein